LISRLNKAENQLVIYEFQNTQLRSNIGELQVMNTSLKHLSDEVENQLSISESQNTQFILDIEELATMNTWLKHVSDEVENELSLSVAQLTQLRSYINECEAMNVSLTSQLNEAKKNYQMLSGDSNVVNNISLEQCDELMLTLNRSEEKLLQRRVNYDVIMLYSLIVS